jgi:hypothetical protein
MRVAPPSRRFPAGFLLLRRPARDSFIHLPPPLTRTNSDPSMRENHDQGNKPTARIPGSTPTSACRPRRLPPYWSSSRALPAPLKGSGGSAGWVLPPPSRRLSEGDLDEAAG